MLGINADASGDPTLAVSLAADDGTFSVTDGNATLDSEVLGALDLGTDFYVELELEGNDGVAWLSTGNYATVPGSELLATLQLERRFSSEPDTLAAVGNGIGELAPQAGELGSTHPDVLAALGTLYADTISHLRPRIMVQGNPHYLGQAGVVSEIRALLLAAVRSAMLWRQLGGSQWHFLLARRAMVDAVVRQLR